MVGAGPVRGRCGRREGARRPPAGAATVRWRVLRRRGGGAADAAPRGWVERGTARGVAHTVAAHVGVDVSGVKLEADADEVATILETRGMVGPGRS